jgi:20S proteasome alpha/beta subunit
MTAIVAKRHTPTSPGFMVADTECLFGYSRGPFKVQKIINLGHTLVGISGLARSCQDLRKILAKTAEKDVVDTISEYLEELDEQSSALVVNLAGDLVTFDPAGCVFRVMEDRTVWAGGSGEDPCLGYLAGVQAEGKREITAEDAVNAIKHAAKNSAGINEICDIEYLTEPKPKRTYTKKKKTKAKRK